MQEKRMSAADVGTAVHAVMQHLPLDRKMALPEIQEFIETLVGKEILSSEEGKAVRAKDIEKFYSSALYERLANAAHVKREVPFTYAKQDLDGDHQIIQGIVDCLFEEEGGWVLLDYKTDNVYGLADVEQEMGVRYGVQLAVYQEAVEAILQIRIKERLLYLFSAEQIVKI
jgi:ATP-dependent helicase/nuclease subunit A